MCIPSVINQHIYLLPLCRQRGNSILYSFFTATIKQEGQNGGNAFQFLLQFFEALFAAACGNYLETLFCQCYSCSAAYTGGSPGYKCYLKHQCYSKNKMSEMLWFVC